MIKKRSLSFIVALITILAIFTTGCQQRNIPEPDIFEVHNGTYVGDNIATSKLLAQLGVGQAYKTTLSTDEASYGITYEFDEDLELEKISRISVFIFALVHNADWIVFQMPSGEIEVLRSELEEFYGRTLTNFNSKLEAEEMMESIGLKSLYLQ